jgi:soluble lytic murein transglycosylase-like protein
MSAASHPAKSCIVEEPPLFKRPILRVARVLTRRKIETLSIAAVAAASAVGIVLGNTGDAIAVPVASATHAAASVVAAYAPKPTPVKTTRARVGTAATSPSSVRLSASSVKRLDLPNLDHPRVESWINRFTTDLRKGYATDLDRMARYSKMISAKLADRGMPQSLVYLAMIESGFNPKARSPVKASGLWQFMGPTAKQYGLTVNKRVDERTNPDRSTDAALKYLSSLHNRLGSWYLAAAAYNSGEGTVTKALKSVTGRTRGTDADYYLISSRLPRETRDYVPKMIAAARIGANPAKYGFSAN